MLAPLLPDPDRMRVHNRVCGTCGSDLHQFLLGVGWVRD